MRASGVRGLGLLALAAWALASPSARAETASSRFTVSAVVRRSCSVAGAEDTSAPSLTIRCGAHSVRLLASDLDRRSTERPLAYVMSVSSSTSSGANEDGVRVATVSF